MNKIYVIGRLTKDCELKTTTSGIEFCRFSVASKSKFKDEAGNILSNFYNCVAWRERAKTISQFCKKGDQVAIVGTMDSRTFKNKQGEDQIGWNITVEDIEFLTTKAEREQSANGGELKKKINSNDQIEFEEIDDDNLPF